MSRTGPSGDMEPIQATSARRGEGVLRFTKANLCLESNSNWDFTAIDFGL